jgi:hypothetical protein
METVVLEPVRGEAFRVGVSTGPPKALDAANPTSSSRTTRTFGAPAGGLSGSIAGKLASLASRGNVALERRVRDRKDVASPGVVTHRSVPFCDCRLSDSRRRAMAQAKWSGLAYPAEPCVCPADEDISRASTMLGLAIR